LQPPFIAPHPPAGYNGPVGLFFLNCSMDQLATRLAGILNQPVNNATGLAGTYDIRLQYSSVRL